jgi:(2S)-methylsuccinyl-CoA dehydrogenase
MDGATAGAETRAMDNLLPTCADALKAADGFLAAARNALSDKVVKGGRVDGAALEAEQFAAHGFAWLTTYVEGLRQMLDWGTRLDAAGKLGDLEALMVQAAFGEYLSQMAGGIALSQVEIVRPADMGVSDDAVHALYTDSVTALIRGGNTAQVRGRIAELIADGHYGELGLEDETLDMIRDQFRRFVDEQVMPDAHEWHLKDDFIPMPVVEQMAELGVFGLTVPEEWGGLGLGKISMCLVTEELSRGYIGVGSRGAPPPIAGPN